MSRTIASIMLSIVALAAAVVVFIATAVIFERRSRRSDAPMFVIAGLVTALFIGVARVWVWKGVVGWAGERRRFMAIVFLTSGGIGFVSALGLRFAGAEYGVESLLGSLTGIVAWLGSLVMIWRETPRERAARLAANTVSCPACGYNLTGLKQTTCPECGGAFRIEELLAGQKPGGDVEA